jgi:hypothetical protein
MNRTYSTEFARSNKGIGMARLSTDARTVAARMTLPASATSQPGTARLARARAKRWFEERLREALFAP